MVAQRYLVVAVGVLFVNVLLLDPSRFVFLPLHAADRDGLGLGAAGFAWLAAAGGAGAIAGSLYWGRRERGPGERVRAFVGSTLLLGAGWAMAGLPWAAPAFVGMAVAGFGIPGASVVSTRRYRRASRGRIWAARSRSWRRARTSAGRSGSWSRRCSSGRPSPASWWPWPARAWPSRASSRPSGCGAWTTPDGGFDDFDRRGVYETAIVVAIAVGVLVAALVIVTPLGFGPIALISGS